MDFTAEAAPTPLEIPPGQFFRDIFGIYHRHFWLFMKFLVPVTIFAYIAVTIAGDIRHEHRIERFESFAVWLGGWLVSWVLYCCAFAGITVAVRGIERGSVPSAEEALAIVREHPMSFLRVSVVLYLLLLVAVGLALGSTTLLLGGLSKLNFRTTTLGAIQAATTSLMFVFLLALSRFGLALPATILDGFTVCQSLFRSDELTSGRVRILVGLLLKSVGGSYIMAIAPFWIVGHVFGATVVPIWEWWVLTALSFLACYSWSPRCLSVSRYIRSAQPVRDPFKIAPAI